MGKDIPDATFPWFFINLAEIEEARKKLEAADCQQIISAGGVITSNGQCLVKDIRTIRLSKKVDDLTSTILEPLNPVAVLMKTSRFQMDPVKYEIIGVDTFYVDENLSRVCLKK